MFSFTFNSTQFNFANNQRLNNQLHNIVLKAVNKSGQNGVDELKSIIKTEVYNAYEPIEYERTYEFLNSWFFQLDSLAQNGNNFLAKFKFYEDFDTMTYDPDKYQHGSYNSGDMRSSIATFIFHGVQGGMFGDGEFSKPRNALATFKEWLNKSFADEVQKELKSRGVGVANIKYRPIN